MYAIIVILLLFHKIAVIDPVKAWKGLETITSFGVGNSRANSLFWAASRAPDFDYHKQDSAGEHPKSKPAPAIIMDPQCALNSACDAAGEELG